MHARKYEMEINVRIKQQHFSKKSVYQLAKYENISKLVLVLNKTCTFRGFDIF